MTVATLSRENFNAACRFIETSARPLEIARFNYAFNEGAGELVFDVLKEYQNADGGFGHALEPDLRTSKSSALCTSIAFQIIRSTQTKPTDNFVSTSIVYLLKTLDREKGHWRIIPSLAEQSPHAPWWNQTEQDCIFSLNPTAEILAYLYDYQNQIPSEILSFVSDKVISYLFSSGKIEMHELLCCLRLLQTKNLSKEKQKQIYHKLTQFVNDIVVCDPAKWKGYSLRPLQIVDSPASKFMTVLEEAVAANLNYEISSQNKDGSWTPTWTWGDAFPSDWMLACREWTGIITLEKLLILKKFKRIDGIV